MCVSLWATVQSCAHAHICEQFLNLHVLCCIVYDVVHNTAQNSSDYFPSLLPNNRRSCDAVYWTNTQAIGRPNLYANFAGYVSQQTMFFRNKRLHIGLYALQRRKWPVCSIDRFSPEAYIRGCRQLIANNVISRDVSYDEITHCRTATPKKSSLRHDVYTQERGAALRGCEYRHDVASTRDTNKNRTYILQTHRHPPWQEEVPLR